MRSTLFLFSIFFALAGLTFAQSGGVKGKVRGPNGKAISSAAISVLLDGKEIKSATTNSKGEFAIAGLAKGKYNILFDADGYSSGTLHAVEVGNGVRDLGDRLILSQDRGNFVILQGSVFFKEGSSVTAAKVDLKQVNADGSTKSLGTTYTGTFGEFAFRRPPGTAKLRVTAKLKDASASKDIDVDEAAIYRIAITLPMSREDR
jgi:Carboxypeptidase regulatory-like domain